MKKLQASFPSILHVELTNACNLKCPICPRIYMKRSVSFIELELIDKIIKESKGKAELVTLHAWGESILHPQFDLIIKRFKDNGIKTQLSTNGTFLDKDKTDKLLLSGLDFLVCSIDAINEATYKKQRAGGNYNKMVENIKWLFKRVKATNSKTFVVAQLVYTTMNKDEVIPFKEKWEKAGGNIWLKPYSTWNGKDEEIKSYQVNGHLKYRKNICDWPWRQMVIHANGKVVPCCNDYDGKEIFGDASNNTLEEIWNGESMKDFRSMHLKGRENIDFCQECKYMSLGTIKQFIFVAINYLDSLKLQTLLENYYKRKL